MADDGSNRFQQRLRLILQQRHLRDAMRVLNDETHDGGLAADRLLLLDVFRDHLNTAVLALQDAGNDEQQIFQDLHQLMIQALQETLDLLYERLQQLVQLERVLQAGSVEDDVPAPAAAEHSLEKQTFRGGAGEENDDGVTECSICLVEFVDGGQITVMPCPSHGHKFHPDCITKWLEIRNTCPLCRHELPTADAYDH